MKQDFLAHTHTEPGSALRRSHGLVDHLNAVANTAAQFGQQWGADWAWIAGLWHDLGKFRPGFQQYIRLVNDAHIEGKLPSSSDMFFEALEDMFEHDRSAARGQMATRGLYVFKHSTDLGNAHAHALFDRLIVTNRDPAAPTRDFGAYEVTFDGAPMAVGQEVVAAPGVTLLRRC